MFLHFGMNTFTDREWGEGKESPTLFNPSALDPRQWARVARAAGFRTLILTAKHHDGFCLWPSRHTDHSVRSSPWREGQGDVVREVAEACQAESLGLGVYLSPWDRHEPLYGDSPRYNDFYCSQLTELLSQYGRIEEVWFDGANGEGPNGKRQVYDWPRIHALVRRLQPRAVMFSDAGPDVRWVGNEDGTASDPNWSPVNPDRVPYPGATGSDVEEALKHGDAAGTIWRPAETDVSIRPGWFWHEKENEKVRTVENLIELYFSSVGRNSKLLLNVPPTREGLIHSVDAERLAGFRAHLNQIFARNLAGTGKWAAQRHGKEVRYEFRLGAPATFDTLGLQEDIRLGQRVSRYRILSQSFSGWGEIGSGFTIGYKKLHRFAPVTTSRIQLVIESAAAPPMVLTPQLYST